MKKRHSQNDIVPNFRRMQGRASGKVIYVVPEGSLTERSYIDHIVDLLADELIDVNIKYQNPKNATIPALLKAAQNIQKQPRDEIWIVLDRDEGNRKDEKQWKNLARWEKESSHHHVAISNPRFEYWLLFHFEETPKKEDAMSDFYFVKKGYFKKYDRKKRVPSNKEKINLKTLNLAITRAKKYPCPTPQNPECVGTGMYMLMQGVLKTAAANKKRRKGR